MVPHQQWWQCTGTPTRMMESDHALDRAQDTIAQWGSQGEFTRQSSTAIERYHVKSRREAAP